jgi:hypothetical protein
MMNELLIIALFAVGLVMSYASYKAGQQARLPLSALGGGSSPHGGMTEFHTPDGSKVRLEWTYVGDKGELSKPFLDVGIKDENQAAMHSAGAEAIDLLKSRGYPNAVISFSDGRYYRSMWTGGLQVRSLWHYADSALAEAEEHSVTRSATVQIQAAGGGAGGNGGVQ